MKRRIAVLVVGVGALLSAPGVGAVGTLDEGKLDSSWFGIGDAEFRQTPHFDYLWVADGFDLDGRTLHFVDWEQPQFLGKERDSKDSARAFELTEKMPLWLRGGLAPAIGESVELSRDRGDVRVEGRFVDVNAGSTAAKWIIGAGAGSAAATWDIRFVDAESGKTLAAIHHRSISGTQMSDIDDKVVKWIDEDFGRALRSGLGTEYAAGKKARK